MKINALCCVGQHLGRHTCILKRKRHKKYEHDDRQAREVLGASVQSEVVADPYHVDSRDGVKSRLVKAKALSDYHYTVNFLGRSYRSKVGYVRIGFKVSYASI